MKRITAKLDKLAQKLENKGFLREAHDIDVVSNTIEALDLMDDSRYQKRQDEYDQSKKNKSKLDDSPLPLDRAVEIYEDNKGNRNKEKIITGIFNNILQHPKMSEYLYKLITWATEYGTLPKAKKEWEQAQKTTELVHSKTPKEEPYFLKKAFERLEAYTVEDSHPSQIEEIDNRLHDPKPKDSELDEDER